MDAPRSLDRKQRVGNQKTARSTLVHQIPIYSDHTELEIISKVGEHNARVRAWIGFLSAYTFTLECPKGTNHSNADFLFRFPQPATEAGRTGPSRLTGPDIAGICPIHPCGFTPREPTALGISLGGLVFPPSRLIPSIQPLPFATDNLTDFRLPTTGAPRSRTARQHLRWVYTDRYHRRWTAPVPGESRRGHRRSSRLGFGAARRLPAIHH